MRTRQGKTRVRPLNTTVDQAHRINIIASMLWSSPLNGVQVYQAVKQADGSSDGVRLFKDGNGVVWVADEDRRLRRLVDPGEDLRIDRVEIEV